MRTLSEVAVIAFLIWTAPECYRGWKRVWKRLRRD